MAVCQGLSSVLRGPILVLAHSLAAQGQQQEVVSRIVLRRTLIRSIKKNTSKKNEVHYQHIYQGYLLSLIHITGYITYGH